MILVTFGERREYGRKKNKKRKKKKEMDGSICYAATSIVSYV